MNKNEFKTFILNKQSGVIVFYSDYCDVCSKYLKIIEQNNLQWEEVSCDDDVPFFYKQHGIDIIPVTRIYEFGNVVWEKLDILTPEEIEYVRNYKLP